MKILVTEKNENDNLVFKKRKIEHGIYQYEVIEESGEHKHLSKEQVLLNINDFANVRLSGNSIYPLEEIEEKLGQKTIKAVQSNVPYILYGGCYRFNHNSDKVRRVLGATKHNFKKAIKELKQMHKEGAGFDYMGVFVILPSEYNTNGKLIKNARVIYAWFVSYDGMERVLKGKQNIENYLESSNVRDKRFVENISDYYSTFEEVAR